LSAQIEGALAVAIEQYSNEVIVVAAGEESSPMKIWLRKETTADLASDLRWLCEEYVDSHVILDLAEVENLETASHGLMLDLQKLTEESEYRFVLCGVSPHVKWQLSCMRLSEEFDTFDTRKAAILELAPDEAY
jgi:anti-anti-sigma regulatory factor